MKINLNDNENKESKSNIFFTSLGFFKYYITSNYKKLTKKIHSIYPGEQEQTKINNNKIVNINKNLNHNIDFENHNNKNKSRELLIFNNAQIKKNVYIFLEKELKINDTKIELRNCNNQVLQIKKYKEFKNKTIIFFFSSIIILKYYNIISITSLCTISLMKKIKIGNIYSNIIINNNQITQLLDKLWNISTQTSKNIFSNLIEIISNNIDKIPLNEKYNKDKFMNLFEGISNEIRNNCNFFIHIIKVLRENIDNLENQYFDPLSIYNNNLNEYKLRFLYIITDIICSNLFYSTFIQSYEEEIKIHIDKIKNYFGEQNEKTFLAIIFDLDTYKSKQFIINENNFNITNNEKEINEKDNKDEILMNYQNCLQSIDI